MTICIYYSFMNSFYCNHYIGKLLANVLVLNNVSKKWMTKYSMTKYFFNSYFEDMKYWIVELPLYSWGVRCLNIYRILLAQTARCIATTMQSKSQIQFLTPYKNV